jgi:hypothetical protein
LIFNNRLFYKYISLGIDDAVVFIVDEEFFGERLWEWAGSLSILPAKKQT